MIKAIFKYMVYMLAMTLAMFVVVTCVKAFIDWRSPLDITMQFFDFLLDNPEGNKSLRMAGVIWAVMAIMGGVFLAENLKALEKGNEK